MGRVIIIFILLVMCSLISSISTKLDTLNSTIMSLKTERAY